MKGSRHSGSRPGSIRIIGGIWRRRRIRVAAGPNLRPTPDRVRETLFNWLAPVLPGARCIDLYAGSGVLGLEALSRGARSAILVESNPEIVAVLNQQCRDLGAAATVIQSDAVAFLERSGIGPFDIAFVDPPYSVNAEPTIERLLGLLAPGARIYLERSTGDPWPEFAGIEWIRQATAGDVACGLGTIG